MPRNVLKGFRVLASSTTVRLAEASLSYLDWRDPWRRSTGRAEISLAFKWNRVAVVRRDNGLKFFVLVHRLFHSQKKVSSD